MPIILWRRLIPHAVRSDRQLSHPDFHPTPNSGKEMGIQSGCTPNL